MASCFCRDSRRSARSCRMADSFSLSELGPERAWPSGRGAWPSGRCPSGSWRPSFLDLWCRLPVSTLRGPSLVDSCRGEG